MQTFETPQPISVDVDITAGSVHLIASPRNDTTVVVNPSDPSVKTDVAAAETTEVGLIDGSVTVTTAKSRKIGNYLSSRPGSVDVTIELPAQSSLVVKVGAGDVTADGQFGNVDVKSGAGAIHIDRTISARLVSGAGNLTLNHSSDGAQVTTAGVMRIGGIDGDATIKNLNGKTWIGEVDGRLRVRSANGDITVDRATSDVAVKTANGNVDVGEVAAGSVTLDTGMGGLTIGIADGAAAWVDARTKFGRVDNSLEPTDAPDGAGGEVEIRARTSFGDIHIHRSSINRETGET